MKKRILSLLLALALVLTGVPMAFATESGFADGNVPEISTDGPVQLPSSNIAEDPTVETDAQQPVEAGEPKLVQNGEDRFSAQLAESEPKADEVVTFIVVMQKSPLLVAGFTKDDIATRAPKAVAYEAALRLELNALKANLTQKFRNDAQFELGYTYTIATTGVAVKTEYGNKEALEALPGVDHVYVAPTFSLPEEESALTSDGELQPMTSNATTMIGAALAGIRVFATGGVGGVHRGAETTMDISADLEELANTPVMVVCAGAKSILDLGLTLEYLETKGVPVIGYRTKELPAFYTTHSGFQVDYRLDTPKEIADAFAVKLDMGLAGGMLVTNPIPDEYAMDLDYINRNIDAAIAETKSLGIHGKDTTPFLLDKIQKLTGGDSLKANIQLVYNNARLGAQIASELAGK